MSIPLIQHTIFVQTGDSKSVELTLRLLEFVYGNKGAFQAMGVKFTVQKFTNEELKQSYVVKLLKDKGVERLPALMTNKKVYHGCDSIIEVYNHSIVSYRNNQKRVAAAPKPKPRRQRRSESTVEDYMKNEIDRFKEDNGKDDEHFGEINEKHLDNRYQDEIMKRNANKPADPGGRRPSTLSDLINDDSYIPKPASASTMFEDDEEDDFDPGMLSKQGRSLETPMSRRIDYEDDGSADDGMISRYLSNQEETF